MRPLNILLVLIIVLFNSVSAQIRQPTRQRITPKPLAASSTTSTGTTTNTTTVPAPSAAVVQSYNWWKYINPTNVNYFGSFSNVSPSNYDTGAIAFSKKTALSLVGWINHSVNMQQAESDDSLAHLEPLVYLEQLLFPCTTGDAGVQHIRNLKSLKNVGFAISGTPVSNITDNGVQALTGLINLETLHLDYCVNITDKGLQQICNMKNLKQLFLSFSGITDNGLVYLKNLSNLQILNIAKSQGITDNGVDALITAIKGMPSFQKLLINGTNITAAGRQKLSANGISFVY